MSKECLSCKDDRKAKGLAPMVKVTLPLAIHANGSFRRPTLATVCCPHCDGETLIASALRQFQEHEGK